ncbi:hypothetical protein JCM10908_002925 [Rhodotorula pacifica]|uniref:myosin 1 n=1 Tax=Rhodotorula pacifica TaxID=1495444 RepID=UPI00317EE482
MATLPGRHARTRSVNQSALDQAALAEWNARKWVWVPDQTKGYLAGWVVKEEGGQSTVALQTGDEMRIVDSDLLTRVNPPNFDGAADIADLTYLNEASVVHNLRLRYQKGDIYTYSGLFLVAVNPYRNLPIYSPQVVEAYKGTRRDQNAPHVYAVAEKAWQNMLHQRDQSQSVLVTGESGAGKTENTKKVIQYLAAIAADPLPSSSSFDLLARQAHADSTLSSGPGTLSRSSSSRAGKKKLGQLERQILEANPILEAFGNAQTVKNNNSSRFGKFVRIFFNGAGAIAGANIDWYLLEKSRVTSRSVEERSFHVFFQLLRGAERDLLDRLLLTEDVQAGTKAFEYLTHSRQDVDGLDDGEEWKTLTRALNTVGFDDTEQFALFRVIAAILHLGQVSTAIAGSSSSSSAHLSSHTSLEKAAFLLGVTPDSLQNALLRPKVKAGREWVTQARSRDQVVDELAALSKTLYEKNFGQLVERINRSLGEGTLANPAGKKTFIGVLDIAGFEIFETNGFEQLCINLTNEKLQQFFNHHMFVLEQEEYAREDIKWDYVNFGHELQPTIDLIEGTNPMGVLACLDDASIMPKATDKSVTEKLDQLAKAKPSAPQFSKYSSSRLEQGFTVQHYAGKVEYRTEGWLEKNRDPLNDNITSLLAQSADSHIASLFSEYAEADSLAPAAEVSGPRTRVRKGAFRTVGQRHKEQLAVLMSQLNETQPHFVRCIVPNLHKSPSEIDVPLVLDQLRCNGVLEGIRIARLGYPNRLAFSEFRRRFELLAPAGAIPKGFVDGAQACSTILSHLQLDAQTYRLGLTKVFFKAGILAELEERRDDCLAGIITKLQASARRFVVRRQAVKILHREQAIRTLQRNARIYAKLRAWPWWPLFQRIRPLLAAARTDDEIRRKEVELFEAKKRAEVEEKEKQRLLALQAEYEQAQLEMAQALEAERALAAEREALLVQSKQREVTLQDSIAAAEQDYETVTGKLERALEAKRSVEDRLTSLDEAYANQTKLVDTLQAAQAAWKAKEAELASQTSVRTEEWDRLKADRAQSASLVLDLKRELSELRQDRRREQERSKTALTALEQQAAQDARTAADARQKLAALETDLRAAKSETTSLLRSQRESQATLDAKEEQLRRLQEEHQGISKTLDLTSQRSRRAEEEVAALKQQLNAAAQSVQKSQEDATRANADLLALKKVVDEHASGQQRADELARLRESEVQDLKFQLSKTTSELTLAQQEHSKITARLQAELDAARSEAIASQKQNGDLEAQVLKQSAKIGQLEAQRQEYAQAEQQHGLAIELVRTEAAELALREREKAEKQLAQLRLDGQALEDRSIADRRDRDAAQREVESYKILLEQEKATIAAQAAEKAKLDAQVVQQHLVLADLDKINGDIRAELASTKARLVVAEERAGRTVVEHIRVLEEAQRLQNAEMDRMRADRDKRDAYVRTLERARATLTQSLEDLQHEREAERVAAFAKRPPKDTTADQLANALSGEKKVRELAELNVTRLRAEVQHLQTALDAAKAEAFDLKRQRDRSERELQRMAASDVTPPSPTKQSAFQGTPGRELPLRPMQENRPVYSTPASPATQAVGIKTETPYGTGYGGVHASRTSIDLKRSSMQLPQSPVGYSSPRRRNYE